MNFKFIQKNLKSSTNNEKIEHYINLASLSNLPN